MHTLRRYGLLALAYSLITSSSPLELFAQDVTPERLFAWVEDISGQDPEGRREFVRAELRKLDVTFQELPFDTTFERRGTSVTVSGTNIIATIGSSGPLLVIGAHYDAVPGSPGSNDNGAGVAVLLGLASTLRSSQLPITVQLCFFDQEERGLIGSAVFVRDHADTVRHTAMINLDIVGFGSELFVGPVGGGDDDVIVPLVEASASAIGQHMLAADVYPSSDHSSFAHAGLENISVSIVPKGDTKRVTAMLKGGKMSDDTFPIVLKTMHTPNDGIDTIEPTSLMLAYRIVDGVVMRLSGKQ